MLATPGLGIPDPDVLAVIEGFVDEHPDVAFQTLSFVPGSTSPFLINGDPVHGHFPPTAGPDLTDRVHQIDLVSLHAAHVATMLPSDDPRPEQWRTELEGLISTGIDDATVTTRLARIERDLQTIEDAIQLPAPFTFTLAGEASTITLRIGNTSTTELLVGVRVSGPSRLAFPEPDTEWLLGAGSITDVTIPIEARSNGTSEVVVEVHTPSGAVIGEPIVLTARVNALSGLGQLLTGAALLVLATWWFSHFRRRRRQRHTAPARNGHPSNARPSYGASSIGRPGPIAAPASGSADRSSSNGDDVSPDAAVASLDQPEGEARRPVTVRIVTDSACDLPGSVASDLDIEIVPLSIRFGDAEFIDRLELTTAEFWAKAAATPTLPSTAAPAPGARSRRPIAERRRTERPGSSSYRSRVRCRRRCRVPRWRPNRLPTRSQCASSTAAASQLKAPMARPCFGKRFGLIEKAREGVGREHDEEPGSDIQDDAGHQDEAISLDRARPFRAWCRALCGSHADPSLAVELRARRRSVFGE